MASSSFWTAATHQSPLVGTERIPCDTSGASTPTYFTPVEIKAFVQPSVTIALAAGATNSINATITMVDQAGTTIAAVHDIEVFIAEDAAGATGLTTDTFSGALTASTGVILTALTAKKHIIATTAATGILVLNLVDSGKPADQYFCVKLPGSGKLIVSAASGTSWGA
jgi:hypothetical protein